MRATSKAATDLPVVASVRTTRTPLASLSNQTKMVSSSQVTPFASWSTSGLVFCESIFTARS